MVRKILIWGYGLFALQPSIENAVSLNISVFNLNILEAIRQKKSLVASNLYGLMDAANAPDLQSCLVES